MEVKKMTNGELIIAAANKKEEIRQENARHQNAMFESDRYFSDEQRDIEQDYRDRLQQLAIRKLKTKHGEEKSRLLMELAEIEAEAAERKTSVE